MTTATEGRAIIKDILEKLIAGYAPQKVILFGSYATGNPRPDSDIDLLIIKDTSERFIDRLTTVRRVLSDPQRIVPLETIVLTPQEWLSRLAIRDRFLEEIAEKGEVLHGE